MALSIQKCIEGWTNSLKQLNVKADIVFYGDSLTYYGNFASVYPDTIVCNLGLRGDTIQGLIDRVNQVYLLEPSVVFLMTGINDVSTLTEIEFERLYKTLVLKLLGGCQNLKLIIQSILPVNNKDFIISCNNNQVKACNEIISQLASEYSLQYIDLYNLYSDDSLLPKGFTVDGIHLTPSKYEIWYKSLRKCII